MNLTGNWSYPTAIKFGAGRITELPEACAGAGMKNPLLVTDKGLAGLPITTRTLDILDAAGLGRAMFAEDRRARFGISKMSATGGPAPTQTRLRRSSLCQQPRAQGPRWAAPASSPTARPM